MLKYLLFPFCFVFSSKVIAQEFNMPSDITKLSAEDCEKYKPDIINCIKWLQNSPESLYKDKRHVSDAFLLNWLSHTKEVNIEIQEYLGPIMDVDPELISIFMGGWALNVLEKKDNNKINGNYAGLKSVLDYYKSDKGVPKSDLLDQLVKKEESRKLKDWLKKQLKD